VFCTVCCLLARSIFVIVETEDELDMGLLEIIGEPIGGVDGC
jgi:hypothetical protein